MTKILITSVGSLVGYNILDVLEGRRQNLQIIGTNSVETDSNIYRCDKAYLLPPTKYNKAEFKNKLLDICAIEQPDLIIPGRDDDIGILADIKNKNEEFADVCLCGSKNAVANMLDKWLTYKFASSYGLPFADSAIPNSQSENAEVKRLLEKYGFPLLVKPRDGFASQGVSVVSDKAQLTEVLKNKNIIIQQYLSNPNVLEKLQFDFRNRGIPLFFSLEEEKYSIQTFVHRDGTVGKIFCTLHRMITGRSLKVEKIKNDQLENIGLRYATSMASEGWFGPLNIQCQLQQSGEFAAYELNGRFTGATSARYYLGFDEVGDTLRTLTGLQLENKKIQVCNSNLISRYVTTRPVPDDAVIEFRDNGYWQSTLDVNRLGIK